MMITSTQTLSPHSATSPPMFQMIWIDVIRRYVHTPPHEPHNMPCTISTNDAENALVEHVNACSRDAGQSISKKARLYQTSLSLTMAQRRLGMRRRGFDPRLTTGALEVLHIAQSDCARKTSSPGATYHARPTRHSRNASLLAA
jgi:hypothetical protein